jgi:hypothetical protein
MEKKSCRLKEKECPGKMWTLSGILRSFAGSLSLSLTWRGGVCKAEGTMGPQRGLQRWDGVVKPLEKHLTSP